MTVLNRIAEGVWGVDTSVGIGLGMHLPLRMTILQDSTGLLLVSPIELDDALASEIAAVGAVHTLLAPNRLHYRHLAAAKKRYAEARVLAAPGLGEKRPELELDAELETGELSPEVSVLLVDGAAKLSEAVLFHKPSKTLIVTDLVFNIRVAKPLTHLLLKSLSGAFGKVEQSRLLRGLTNDRQAAARSVDQVLALPFERVIPAHGAVIEQRAKDELSAGLWWMRGGTERPQRGASSETSNRTH